MTVNLPVKTAQTKALLWLDSPSCPQTESGLLHLLFPFLKGYRPNSPTSAAQLRVMFIATDHCRKKTEACRISTLTAVLNCRFATLLLNSLRGLIKTLYRIKSFIRGFFTGCWCAISKTVNWIFIYSFSL